MFQLSHENKVLYKSIHVNYTLQGGIIIKSLIYFGSIKLFRNTLDSVLSNIEQVLFFEFFFTKLYLCFNIQNVLFAKVHTCVHYVET